MVPLAERMRPKTINEVIGQTHLLYEGSPLQQMIAQNKLPSIIFWGPPGVGKTTLALVIAQTHLRPFKQLSAIQAGVKEIREVLAFAESHPNTILFIDEIHRFNKSQQDSLLGAVEKGLVTLIGATTENPSFEVNSALLSRSQVFVLQPLTKEEMDNLLQNCLQKDVVFSTKKVNIESTTALYQLSGGDARKMLTLLEMVLNVQTGEELTISDENVMKTAQKHVALYDKSGEQHYDIISAFIKSIRGGDPNAAVYWLARMLAGGEDVKFIARRLIILASEDIGNANPNALLLANACFQSVNVIGMPEARIVLSQTATYLATSEKSNAAYMAINDALKIVETTPNFAVPLHLRNSPTPLMKDLNYGKEYKYSHSFVGNAGNQEFLPNEIAGRVFYRPKEIGAEKKIKGFISEKWGEKYKS